VQGQHLGDRAPDALAGAGHDVGLARERSLAQHAIHALLPGKEERIAKGR
jgi:hypothetical protein